MSEIPSTPKEAIDFDAAKARANFEAGINKKFDKPPTEKAFDTSEKSGKESLQAEWNTYKENEAYGVKVSLPDKGFIAATLTYLEQEGAYMEIDMFQVHDGLQGQGIGSRLLKSLVVEGKGYGATRLGGHVTSESALRTRAKVFGKENLIFFNEFTGKPLNITYEEALAEGGIDYRVEIDLTKTDTLDWERAQRVGS